jgi:nucleoside phosphorylase
MQYPRDDYNVGWICALSVELAAARKMLDAKYGEVQDGDTIFELGQVGEHKVVIGFLPGGETGLVSAAVVAGKLTAAFKSIKIGLMVGVGAGVPSNEQDIRLGDVVISNPARSARRGCSV